MIRGHVPALLAGPAAALFVICGVAAAGVINPDISVVGQPFMSLTDDPDAAGRKRPRLDIGETEVVFDAALNPYARGFFTMAFGEEGFELEEGYFNLVRALPVGLALRGGRYRAGFGRLNPVHPHALPFAERFNVLAAYLPGEEALIEIGASLSRRLVVAGETSVLLSGDWLQGDSFRVQRASSGDASDPLEQGGDDGAGESRPAFLGRAALFSPLGEQSGLELGLSVLGGTNNVAAAARTRVFGADAKAKLWTNPRAYLVVQAEALHLDRDEVGWDPASVAYVRSSVTPAGGYVFADYNWATRYNVGASYEGFQRPTAGEEWDETIGAFAGLALLEETTAFRAEWRRSMPDHGHAVNTFTLRVLYSMGPHKAHQF
jgi:hypothetical protein